MCNDIVRLQPTFIRLVASDFLIVRPQNNNEIRTSIRYGTSRQMISLNLVTDHRIIEVQILLTICLAVQNYIGCVCVSYYLCLGFVKLNHLNDTTFGIKRFCHVSLILLWLSIDTIIKAST